MLVTILLATAICLATFWIVSHLRWKFQYFKRHGIPYAPGYFPLGSLIVWQCFAGQKSLLEIPNYLFDSFPKSKVFGYFKCLGEPVLAIKDLELTKRIMVKDFDHFIDRNFLKIHPEANKYMRNMLMNIKGDHWKSIRNLLTPMFTASKMKTIMPFLNANADRLSSHLSTRLHEANIDVKDVYQRFTIEVLGNLGCGVEGNVIEGQENVFYKKAMILSGSAAPPVLGVLKFVFSMMFPDTAYDLKIDPFDSNTYKFFETVVLTSVKNRAKSHVRRNDFLDLMLDTIKELGEKEEDFSYIQNQDDVNDFIVTNAIMLFFVGNDTTSGAIALTILNLALHQEVQEKLYNEIMDTIEQNEGNVNLDYEQLNSMSYLGKVIKESIRLWGLNFFDRTCTKDYYIPELNFTVPKGMHVNIAGGKIMRDSENFLNPDAFDPDQHFEDHYVPPNFIAFGHGPRQCIGMRLAFILTRTALVHTLYHFKVVPSPKTTKNWFWNPIVPGGLDLNSAFVKFQKREI